MADLRTNYLGMELGSPIVVSASPLSGRLDTLLRLQEAGAGAVVMQSLFEEQIEREEIGLHELLDAGAESFPEAASYFPALDDYNTGPRAHLEYLEAVSAALDVPVIGSLNGSSRGGWLRYARSMEEAGVAAIELNVYFVAADPSLTSAEVEQRYLDIVSAVRETVAIPVSVKVGPYFSAMANMALRLVDAGADGLVLFNRFLHPDIDLEALAAVPTLQLSQPAELRLPLRWIAILRGLTDASLAATTGIHSAPDALKALLAGADVAMMASALLRHGPDHLAAILRGVAEWMREHEYESVRQLVGSLSRASGPDPAAFERSQYMRALTAYSVRILG
ncbi:MAG: dihydroorotate dehydrogenase-like protein [Actinobacteria bacterium]|nr:dihydroorotate dehydrogenase-like protein [Actinomycetota bacterium]